MKHIVKHGLLSIPLMLFATFVHSETSMASGTVGMKGQIYVSACTIATESLDQTVSMGNTPIHELLEQGTGASKFFDIRLVDCDFGRNHASSRNDLEITFDGASEGDIFIISGDASGVGLKISSTGLKSVTPNMPMTLSESKINNYSDMVTLTYQIQLVEMGKNISSGKYYTVLNFKLDYK